MRGITYMLPDGLKAGGFCLNLYCEGRGGPHLRKSQFLDRERTNVPQVEQRSADRAIPEMIGSGCGDSRIDAVIVPIIDWHLRVVSTPPRTPGSPSELLALVDEVIEGHRRVPTSAHSVN